MPRTPNTNLPPAIDRETLKTVIKGVVREMLADARSGKTELPPGLPATADMVADYKVRLALADALLNPPSVRSTTPVTDPRRTAEWDSDPDSLVGQVAAELEPPRERKAEKKRGRRQAVSFLSP